MEKIIYKSRKIPPILIIVMSVLILLFIMINLFLANFPHFLLANQIRGFSILLLIVPVLILSSLLLSSLAKIIINTDGTIKIARTLSTQDGTLKISDIQKILIDIRSVIEYFITLRTEQKCIVMTTLDPKKEIYLEIDGLFSKETEKDLLLKLLQLNPNIQLSQDVRDYFGI